MLLVKISSVFMISALSSDFMALFFSSFEISIYPVQKKKSLFTQQLLIQTCFPVVNITKGKNKYYISFALTHKSTHRTYNSLYKWKSLSESLIHFQVNIWYFQFTWTDLLNLTLELFKNFIQLKWYFGFFSLPKPKCSHDNFLHHSLLLLSNRTWAFPSPKHIHVAPKLGNTN